MLSSTVSLRCLQLVHWKVLFVVLGHVKIKKES